MILPFLQMGQHCSGSYTGLTHSGTAQSATTQCTSLFGSQRHHSQAEGWRDSDTEQLLKVWQKHIKVLKSTFTLFTSLVHISSLIIHALSMFMISNGKMFSFIFEKCVCKNRWLCFTFFKTCFFAFQLISVKLQLGCFD